MILQEVEEEVPVEMEVDAPKDGAAPAESDKKEHESCKMHYLLIKLYLYDNRRLNLDEKIG